MSSDSLQLILGGVHEELGLGVHGHRNNFVCPLSYSSVLMETVDSISFEAFVALTEAGLGLIVDNTGGSGSTQVDLGAVKPVPVTLPVLHWSTELSAFGGNFGDSTLLHLACFTDGTAPILGIVEARSSPGGEGVLVVWYSLTPHFRFRVLTPFMHWGPTLFAAINAFPTFVPH